MNFMQHGFNRSRQIIFWIVRLFSAAGTGFLLPFWEYEHGAALDAESNRRMVG